jgi:HPt (histidine-containing phosphotransfer) domain-containing protein
MKANIDRDYLVNMLGSERAAEQFITLFQQESKQLVIDLFMFWDDGDYKNLTIAAHGLKSHLRYVKANELADIAQKIESMAEQKQLNWELKELISNFTEKMKELI